MDDCIRCWKCKIPILGSDGVLCPKCCRDERDKVRELDISSINK